MTDERFWAKVQKTDGCWLWTGAVSAHGYGTITRRPKRYRVHRWAWQLVNGPIPAGLYVCHHCDNPRCVRPDHLFLGDDAANVRDMHAKGRDRNGKESQTHCKHGHEFTVENTILKHGFKHGARRQCRTCRNERYKQNKQNRAENPGWVRERERLWYHRRKETAMLFQNDHGE